MINLLPALQKKEMAAARINTILFRYTILLIGAIVLLLLFLGFVYFYLITTGVQADNDRKNNEEKAAGYTQTQAEAAALRTDIAAAKQLFSNEIRYSKALTRISALIPNGVAFTTLDLDGQSFGVPKTFVMKITGKAAAEELRTSLQKSEYFSNVSLNNLSTSFDDTVFPYTIELTATINRSIAQ